MRPTRATSVVLNFCVGTKIRIFWYENFRRENVESVVLMVISAFCFFTGTERIFLFQRRLWFARWLCARYWRRKIISSVLWPSKNLMAPLFLLLFKVSVVAHVSRVYSLKRRLKSKYVWSTPVAKGLLTSFRGYCGCRCSEIRLIYSAECAYKWTASSCHGAHFFIGVNFVPWQVKTSLALPTGRQNQTYGIDFTAVLMWLGFFFYCALLISNWSIPKHLCHNWHLHLKTVNSSEFLKLERC